MASPPLLEWTKSMTHLKLVSRWAAACLIASAIAQCGWAQADDAPVNLLKNPSMEESEKNAAGEDDVAVWKRGDDVAGVAYSWKQTSGVGGKAGLGIKKTANQYFPIAQFTQTIPHTGSETVLQLSAQVKTKAATKAVLDVQFLDEKGEWISHEWIAYIGSQGNQPKPLSHNWKAYTGAVTIPPNTKQIVIGLQDYGPGEVWFDDVSAVYLKELPKEPNNVPK